MSADRTHTGEIADEMLMLLCHHSAAGKNAVRRASPGGHVFVACVVVLMLLSVFGEAWELAALEVELLATDAALEFLGSLGLAHWNLIELVLAGALMSWLIGALLAARAWVMRSLRSVETTPPDKIPI